MKLVSAPYDETKCGMCDEPGVEYALMPWGAVHLCIHHVAEHRVHLTAFGVSASENPRQMSLFAEVPAKHGGR